MVSTSNFIAWILSTSDHFKLCQDIQFTAHTMTTYSTMPCSTDSQSIDVVIPRLFYTQPHGHGSSVVQLGEVKALYDSMTLTSEYLTL